MCTVTAELEPERAPRGCARRRPGAGSVDRLHGEDLPKAEYRHAYEGARMVAGLDGVYLHRTERCRAIERYFSLRTRESGDNAGRRLIGCRGLRERRCDYRRR